MAFGWLECETRGACGWHSPKEGIDVEPSKSRGKVGATGLKCVKGSIPEQGIQSEGGLHKNHLVW